MRPRLLPPLFLILLLILLPTAQAAYQLSATPDHKPWGTAGDVERLAVRPGNCMTWTLSVTNNGSPVQGAAISVTDGDGRRSIHYTGKDGIVVVGTRTCFTSDHVSDHAFEVTAMFDGSPASSNRVLQEVMWSGAQVYLDAPTSGDGSTSIPVSVVWTATNEPVPVSTASVIYGQTSFDSPLDNGTGAVTVDLDGCSELTVGVPYAASPSGGVDSDGNDLRVTIDPAGPFVIRSASGVQCDDGGSGGGGGGGSGASDTTSSSSGTSSTSSTSAPGSGTPPPPDPPERQQLPPPATPQDHETTSPDYYSSGGNQAGDGNGQEGASGTGPGQGKGSPGPGWVLVVGLLALAAWRSRR